MDGRGSPKTNEQPRHPREYPIHRPYAHECPEDFFGYELTDEDLDWVRVAKHDAVVVAAYHIKPISHDTYQLAGLAVDRNYRRRGIGHWMLAHAIGVIESKGGRTVVAFSRRKIPIFEQVGFERIGATEYRLLLEPE